MMAVVLSQSSDTVNPAWSLSLYSKMKHSTDVLKTLLYGELCREIITVTAIHVVRP